MFTPQDYEKSEQEMFGDYEEAQKRQKKASGLNLIYQIEEDRSHILRLLVPPVSPKKRYSPCYVYDKHFLKTTEGKYVVVNCAMKNEGVCPVCAKSINLSSKSEYAKKTGEVNESKALYSQSYNIRPQQEFLYTALDEDNNFVFLQFNAKAFGLLKNQIDLQRNSLKDKYISIFDIKAGRNIIVKKTKKKKGKGARFEWEWTVSLFPDRTSIPEEIIKNYEALYIYPEDTLVKNYTIKDLEDAANGNFDFVERYKQAKNTEGSSQQETIQKPIETPIETPKQASIPQGIGNASGEVDEVKQEIDDEIESLMK